MLIHGKITESIIASFYDVYNTLGYGFLEKVYENALALELAKQGFDIKAQVPIPVFMTINRWVSIMQICL